MDYDDQMAELRMHAAATAVARDGVKRLSAEISSIVDKYNTDISRATTTRQQQQIVQASGARLRENLTSQLGYWRTVAMGHSASSELVWSMAQAPGGLERETKESLQSWYRETMSLLQLAEQFMAQLDGLKTTANGWPGSMKPLKDAIKDTIPTIKAEMKSVLATATQNEERQIPMLLGLSQPPNAT